MMEFEEFYKKVEKVDYEFSACFNCKHDAWKEIYDEEGWGGTWDQWCAKTGRTFEDGKFPKECILFEPRNEVEG
jgi:hypothetical protein